MIDFVLDPSYPHDIKEISGSWQFFPLDEGERTLGRYHVQGDWGISLPQFIENFVMHKSNTRIFEAVQKRAASGGAWKK